MFPDSTRTVRQLKEKYNNKIKPDMNHDRITQEEENQLLQYVKQYGQKWRKIGSMMNRTENCVRNYYILKIKQRESDSGFEIILPASHDFCWIADVENSILF
jgi:hypothetical protein